MSSGIHAIKLQRRLQTPSMGTRLHVPIVGSIVPTALQNSAFAFTTDEFHLRVYGLKSQSEHDKHCPGSKKTILTYETK